MRASHSSSLIFSRQRGFTLVEIMVAIFILSVALLGLVSVTVMVMGGNYFSRTMTTATTLAKDKMEELRNTGQRDLNLVTAGGPETLETIYSRSWTVTNTVVGGSITMKTVTVTVTWTWKGLNRSVSVNTIIAK